MLAVLGAAAFPAVAAPLPAAAQIAYVASLNNGGVVSVDTATNQQGVPVSVPGAGAIAITPDGATVYVTSGSSVTPIDTATGTAEPAIAIGGRADGIAVSPDGRTVYVTSTQANSVTPVNTATNVAGPPLKVDLANLAVRVSQSRPHPLDPHWRT